MREGALSVLVVRRRDRWVDAWNRLDLLVVLLSYVSMVLEAAFASVGSGVASLRALRLLRLLRLLRAMRAFGKISGASLKTRVLVTTFAQFGKIIVPMVFILTCMAYTYAIVGMELLGDALDSKFSMTWDSYCSPLCPAFDSFAHAMLALFQMLIAANWSSILEEAIQTTGQLWMPTIFFMSYITLCHVFMLSLLAALVLEVYAVEMDKAANSDNEDKMQILCDATAEREAVPAGTQVMLSAGVRKRFQEFDVDGSGSLVAAELRELLVQLGSHELSDDELNDAMQQLDADNSGLVDYDEFLPWWRLRGLKSVFAKRDKDGSGNLDSTEFAAVALELGLNMTPSELADAQQMLDKDGSGEISLDEYMAWFDLYDMQLEFEKFDKDKTGTVNKREFIQLVSSLGITLTRKERDKVFSMPDKDNNEVVTFAEFHPW